jgi:hypothetical protein
MIEKFATIGGQGSSEFLDLNHTSRDMALSVPYDPEIRSRARQRTQANFGIGTLA